MSALKHPRRVSFLPLFAGIAAAAALFGCGENHPGLNVAESNPDELVPAGNSGDVVQNPVAPPSQSTPALALSASDAAQMGKIGEQFVAKLAFPGAGSCELRVVARCDAYPSALGAALTLPGTAAGCQRMAEYLSNACKLVNSVSGSFTKNPQAPDELPNLLVDPTKEKEPIKPSDGCPETAVEDIFKAIDGIGEPTEVVFWDTFCGPCRAKLPTLDPKKVLIVMLGARADAEAFLQEPQFKGKKFQCMTEVSNEATKHFKISGIPFSKILQPRVDDSLPNAPKVGSCKVSINQCTRFKPAEGKYIERKTTANMCTRLASFVSAACGSPGGSVGVHTPSAYDLD